MSRKVIEPKNYEQWEVLEHTKKLVQVSHEIFANQEKAKGQRLYDTFGEWKKENPNHPIAKKNYPDNEYLQVISNYRQYFDIVCAEREELL